MKAFSYNPHVKKYFSSLKTAKNSEKEINDFVLLPKHNKMYAVDGGQNVIMIVDLSTDKIIKKLSIPLDDSLISIIASSDEKKVYFSTSKRKIYIIDTDKNEIIGEINNLNQNDRSITMGMTLSPDGRYLYGIDAFVRLGNENFPKIYVIDTKTDRVVTSIKKTILSSSSDGWGVRGYAFNSDGSLLYINSDLDLSISILNTRDYSLEDGAIKNNFLVFDCIAINKENNKLYTLAWPSVIAAINLETRQIIQEVHLNTITCDMAFDKNKEKMYVANCSDNTVSVFDVAKNNITYIRDIPVGRSPYKLGFSQDNSKLYVANHVSNDISIIDIETEKVIKTITL
jgi:YVTN family beta-propeller protein